MGQIGKIQIIRVALSDTAGLRIQGTSRRHLAQNFDDEMVLITQLKAQAIDIVGGITDAMGI